RRQRDVARRAHAADVGAAFAAGDVARAREPADERLADARTVAADHVDAEADGVGRVGALIAGAAGAGVGVHIPGVTRGERARRVDRELSRAAVEPVAVAAVGGRARIGA